MTKTKEFLELNVDVLVSILSLDELNVSSESDVFNAAIQWLDSAPSDELKKKKHALASKSHYFTFLQIIFVNWSHCQ